MENSMYYTFSTIAQVLAAFIGITGVFVLFKAQEIKKAQLQQVQNFLDHIEKMNNQSESLKKAYSDLRKLYQAGYLYGMQELLIHILIDLRENDNPRYVNIKGIPYLYLILRKRFKILLRISKWAIYIGVPTIIYSFLMLSRFLCMNNANIIIGITLATISIVLISLAIYLSFAPNVSDKQIKKYARPNIDLTNLRQDMNIENEGQDWNSYLVIAESMLASKQEISPQIIEKIKKVGGVKSRKLFNKDSLQSE